jgi:penicillin-binding protein 1A
MARGSRVWRVVGVLLGTVVVVLGTAFAWVWFAPCQLGGCAPVQNLAEYQAEGSELLDVHGEPFAMLATVNRRIVPVDSLPPHVTQAIIAIEDRRFYEHGGVDFWRLAGALVSNVRAGGVAEGGSTITQQLARNLFPEWLPYQDRSMRRKVMEARVARQLEGRFSKDKILELYINHIYLGEGAYGIEAAAQTYFGKPAAELSIAEAALIAGLPQAPSRANPVVNPERAERRRNVVLQEMAQAGFITRAQMTEAVGNPVRLAERGESAGVGGSYFVERVRREMDELVGSRFYTAGLRVHTTLDPLMQQAAEEELVRQLDAVEAGQFGTYRHPTFAGSHATRGDEQAGSTAYLQGAVVTLDAATGEVRALVGGRDFQDSKFDRATQALRQPGSAFKPVVYLAALGRYDTPAHQLDDSPLRLTLSGGRTWEPRNYTGTYDGPITMRDALARSKNVATVRLAQEVGMGSVVRTARNLGITTDIPNVPATALGAADVRPIELVAAYAPLANGGRKVEPHFIRRVEDRGGRVVWEAGTSRGQVVDPAAAFVLTSMLRDVVDRGTGTAVRAAGFRGPAAGKTGTTNEATDVWFVGYTPDLVTGVWMGFDDPATIIRGASGGTIVAPVWGRMMRRVYEGRSMPEEWRPPSNVHTAEVEVGTGRVVSEYCPAQGPTYTEYFLRMPAAQACPEAAYPRYTVGDTLWWDEEWGGDDRVVLDPPVETGRPRSIDWPELDELRERIRIGGARDADPGREPPPAPRTDPANPSAPPVLGEPARPREAPSAPATTTPPAATTPPPAATPAPPPAPRRGEPEAEPPPPPRVLGVPVQRDTTASGAPPAREPAERLP